MEKGVIYNQRRKWVKIHIKQDR